MAAGSGVALFGNFSKEQGALRGISAHVCDAAQAADLATLFRDLRLLAVFIHAETAGAGWPHALDIVRAAAPGIPAVVCHGLDALDTQDEMTEAGAYYTLLLPADEREVRRLLDQLPSGNPQTEIATV
jgi:voltage-gated potassium channel Kch